AQPAKAPTPVQQAKAPTPLQPAKAPTPVQLEQVAEEKSTSKKMIAKMTDFFSPKSGAVTLVTPPTVAYPGKFSTITTTRTSNSPNIQRSGLTPPTVESKVTKTTNTNSSNSSNVEFASESPIYLPSADGSKRRKIEVNAQQPSIAVENENAMAYEATVEVASDENPFAYVASQQTSRNSPRNGSNS
ncbi:MAG: hypothetical protein JSS07_01875, partial [Proteobacteria bacterium]|nr:hypothetical protein [Pseudomonadota bacterium]